MTKDFDTTSDGQLRNDRELFSSLLKHIVQSAPNEDPTDFVLSTIGRNVGADRCYVYRFWNPGKSSMCTNTHEWCADGIQPKIAAQQACNLADLVEFNARITSGRDFLFSDIDAIDAGSRERLEPQGIKSLIATPIVGANDVICGFAGFDFVKAPCAEFTDRIVFNIHEAADLLLNCQRLHERELTLQDVSRRESDHEEDEREFDRALMALQADARAMQPKQMLEIVRNRLDADLCYIVEGIRTEGGGAILPEHALARNGWTNTRRWTIDPELGRAFDLRLLNSSVVSFRGDEIAWLKANIEADRSPPDEAVGLDVVHSIGVRQDGRLVGVLCVGYTDGRQLAASQIDFLRRSALVIVSALERITTYHDLTVALNIAHLKGEVVEFMFRHHDYVAIRDFIGRKVCDIIGAQHFMLCTDDGTRTDWFGEDAPSCCRGCVDKAVNFGRHLPADLFDGNESVIIRDGEPLPDMNLPHYCPMRSSVVSQFKNGKGWWRLVADYTKPHSHNLNEVARGLRTALELLSIAYNREQREKAIATIQEHQKFRADALAYALSKDDPRGLMDLVMHRLLDLSACDYIAIHSVEGDHLHLHAGGGVGPSPDRCTACPYYHLHLPHGENSNHFLELGDARKQAPSPLPSDCPAVSLGIAVVHCDGKPWGGIALHYLNKQHKISDDDRQTLNIAANVLSLALERHSAALRLKAERDRVLEADRARSYFFSAVSHDIRTPLNAIIGFSELLEAGGVPPEEAKRNLKMIVESGKTLLQLVNDVLDLSKMDLGKLEFVLEPTDVGQLVREILPVFEPAAAANGQTIVADIPEMPRLMVDSHRFRQVLFNFVSNAVKYAGPCTIRVSPSYGDGLFRITVADDGKGVSAEKAKRLMQPFVQADIKNRTEGSGLGLSICKSLVELAHGKISIDTAPGKGFAIHVEVPVDVAPDSARGGGGQSASSAEVEVPKRSRRILVVDDSPVNRLVMRAMLTKLGITDIVLAEDGKVALAKLEEGPPFDMVLSDLWMPVMDGNELVKRIRADERFASLKVCAITADVEMRSTFKGQGFDKMLLKPVTLEKMTDLFNETA